MEIAKKDLLIRDIIYQINYQKDLLRSNIKRLAEESQTNPHVIRIVENNNHAVEKKNIHTQKQINALKCINNYLNEVKNKNISTKHIIDEVNIDIKGINKKLDELQKDIELIHNIPSLTQGLN